MSGHTIIDLIKFTDNTSKNFQFLMACFIITSLVHLLVIGSDTRPIGHQGHSKHRSKVNVKGTFVDLSMSEICPDYERISRLLQIFYRTVKAAKLASFLPNS